MNKDLPVNSEDNQSSGAHKTKSSKTKDYSSYTLPAKVAAFIITIITLSVATASIFVSFIMLTSGVYMTPMEEVRDNIYSDIAQNNSLTVLNNLNPSDISRGGEARLPDDAGAEAYVRRMVDNGNISSITIDYSQDKTENGDTWTYGAPADGDFEYKFRFYHLENKLTNEDPDVPEDQPRETWYTSSEPEENNTILGTATVTIRISPNLVRNDRYNFASRLIKVMYSLRVWIYVIAFVSALTALGFFIFLMCASGRHPNVEEAVPGFGTGIPFDLLLSGAGILMSALMIIFTGMIDSSTEMTILSVLVTVPFYSIILGLAMSIAVRIKLGTLWKNTIVYRVIRLIGKFFKFIGSLIAGIPTVWKTIVILLTIGTTDIIVMVLTQADDAESMYYVFRAMVIVPSVLYCAIMLRRLLKDSKSLADGDLSYRVKTKGMILDFRKAGENLNSISNGMSHAVSEQTKSERMKAALITNVSHDIKTPLTSIINYSDLICKEPAGSDRIPEYSEVLHRQSEKLKRLIDDLVEASKASTGNLEVVLAPCNLNELLSQAEGEYEQKFESSGLTLVATLPEEEVHIIADGRRLWRIIDNLLNNACKYALPGTRVFMTLERMDGVALLTFKNTSKAPLNISADELLERFVRGDASRNTEGNGLGLSIARSLTELQNGHLELFIDGDLFKAEVTFPLAE